MASKTPEQVLKETALAIDRGFEKFRQDKTLSEFAQKEIAPNIVKRSRLGFGVRLQSKQQYKFPPLSKEYISQRGNERKKQELGVQRIALALLINSKPRVKRSKGLIKSLRGLFVTKKKRASKGLVKKKKSFQPDYASLHPETSPAKSNITATGLLLDKGIGATARARQIIIFIKNLKYSKNIFGKRIKNPPTTIDVAGYLQDNLDREFLQTSQAEDNRLSRVMSKLIIKDIETELSKIK